MSRRRLISSEAIVSLVAVVAALILWWALTESLVRPLFFPSPAETVAAFDRLVPVLPEYIFVTSSRVIVGMIVGIVLGVACGLAMTWNRWINSALDPLIEGFRPVPAIALIPFFILWFGIGDFGKIVLTAIGGFTVMVVTTIEAVKNVPPIYVMAARTLGAPRREIYRTVMLPAISPTLIGGVRVSVALSFALVIASEFMGAQSGLGYMIMYARRTLQTDAILVGILAIGVLSFLADRLVRYVGDRVTRWAPR